jgi:bifunctional DNA-binding transcriptional regulator/antitoxin component of YhaV-PrlF toxin-antitoxin module
MSSVVGQKGQIVIEKPIRDALRLEPGHLAIQRLVSDHVEIYFYPPEHEESLRGVLADRVKRTAHAEEWSEAQEEAWSAAVRSEWDRDEAAP